MGFTIVLTLVMLLAIAPAVHPQEPSNDPDSVAIYLKLLPKSSNGKMPLILKTTTTSERCPVKVGDVPEPDFRQAVESFMTENRVEHDISSVLAHADGYRFITRPEFASYFGKNIEKGWKRFYKKNLTANGVVSFSVVGFNSSRTAAVVYKDIVSCSLCGNGRLHFFRKGGTGWYEVNDIGPYCGWIS